MKLQPGAETQSDAPQRQPRLLWILFSLGILGLLGSLSTWNIPELFRASLEVVGRLGSWGILLFVGIYILATVASLPASVLTLGAGAVFGIGWGFASVSMGSILGASAAFLIGRHLARDRIARRIEGNQAFAAIDRAVGEQGWKIVLLTRLSPVFPFVLLNYAFGLTRVSFRDFVFASWIGMIPGTFLYVYLGSLARAGIEQRERTPVQWTFYAAGLLATLGVTIVITRIAKRALAQKAR